MGNMFLPRFMRVERAVLGDTALDRVRSRWFAAWPSSALQRLAEPHGFEVGAVRFGRTGAIAVRHERKHDVEPVGSGRQDASGVDAGAFIEDRPRALAREDRTGQLVDDDVLGCRKRVAVAAARRPGNHDRNDRHFIASCPCSSFTGVRGVPPLRNLGPGPATTDAPDWHDGPALVRGASTGLDP